MTKAELIRLMAGTSDEIEIFVDWDGVIIPISDIKYAMDTAGNGHYVIKT